MSPIVFRHLYRVPEHRHGVHLNRVINSN